MKTFLYTTVNTVISKEIKKIIPCIITSKIKRINWKLQNIADRIGVLIRRGKDSRARSLSLTHSRKVV